MDSSRSLWLALREISIRFTVSMVYSDQRPGKLAPFRNEVIALRSKGTLYKEIYTSLCAKGYTGSEAAIRQFIAKEKRLRKDLKGEETADPTEIVERKWLVKLLYKPMDKVKAISSEQVKNVFQRLKTSN